MRQPRAGFEELDDDVLLALGDHAGAVLENGRLHGELRASYMATVRMLAEAIEVKDPSVRLHSDEVASYVAAVASKLAIGARRREELTIASLLHATYMPTTNSSPPSAPPRRGRESSAQVLRQPAQHLVADVVAEAVVHALEVVDVDLGERERLTEAIRRAHEELERLTRATAVGDPVNASVSAIAR